MQGVPITLTGHWMWDHELATIRSCGEGAPVPRTDNAEFLRLRLTARDAKTSQPLRLANSRIEIKLNGMSTSRSAIAGPDGVAIMQDVPATSGYEFNVRPPGCGEFHFGNQVVLAGRDRTLELNLGTLASLDVRVSEEKAGRRVPLPGAMVAGQVSDEHTSFVGGETDSSGRAVLACIPASSKVNLRINYPYHLWEDVCGVEVGPGGRSSVDVLPRVNPDPRRRVVPGICEAAAAKP
jgi:hypothetical protein